MCKCVSVRTVFLSRDESTVAACLLEVPLLDPSNAIVYQQYRYRLMHVRTHTHIYTDSCKSTVNNKNTIITAKEYAPSA